MFWLTLEQLGFVHLYTFPFETDPALDDFEVGLLMGVRGVKGSAVYGDRISGKGKK